MAVETRLYKISGNVFERRKLFARTKTLATAPKQNKV